MNNTKALRQLVLHLLIYCTYLSTDCPRRIYSILFDLIRDALKHVTRIDESKYLIKYLIQSADAAIKLVIQMK